MSQVTTSELMRRFYARLSERQDDAGFLQDQDVLDYLNEAQDVIVTEVPFTVKSSWTFLTIPNCPVYLVPEDCIHPTGAIIRYSGGSKQRLTTIMEKEMDGLKSRTNGARIPSQYLELAVEGHRRPTALTTTSEYTDIPAYITTPLINYAYAKFKQKDEEQGQYDRAWKEFKDSVTELQYSRMRTQYDEHNRMRLHRGVYGPWPWSGLRPWTCTFYKSLDGTTIEIYGI